MYRRQGLVTIIGIACLILSSCSLTDYPHGFGGYYGSAAPTSVLSTPVATPQASPAPPTPTETPVPPSPSPAPDQTPLASPTPSASPGSPGELKGWELNESNTGLAGVGLSCDKLPLYTGGERVPAGTTIREKRIERVLDLSEGNITIERSCVRPTTVGRGLPLLSTTDFSRCVGGDCPPAPGPATLRDCEIDGSLVDNFSIGYSLGFGGFGSVERCYIHDVGSGIGIYGADTQVDSLVADNYITRLRAWGDPANGGSHNDGLTVRNFPNPARHAVLRNNRVIALSGNDTGALFIQPNDASIDNVLVEGNLLEGNGHQLGLEAANGLIFGRSMRAVDNRFSGTGFGPAYVDTRRLVSYGWAEWTGNYINDPTKPDNRGLLVPVPQL